MGAVWHRVQTEKGKQWVNIADERQLPANSPSYRLADPSCVTSFCCLQTVHPIVLPILAVSRHSAACKQSILSSCRSWLCHVILLPANSPSYRLADPGCVTSFCCLQTVHPIVLPILAVSRHSAACKQSILSSCRSWLCHVILLPANSPSYRLADPGCVTSFCCLQTVHPIVLPILAVSRHSAAYKQSILSSCRSWLCHVILLPKMSGLRLHECFISSMEHLCRVGTENPLSRVIKRT